MSIIEAEVEAGTIDLSSDCMVKVTLDDELKEAMAERWSLFARDEIVLTEQSFRVRPRLTGETTETAEPCGVYGWQATNATQTGAEEFLRRAPTTAASQNDDIRNAALREVMTKTGGSSSFGSCLEPNGSICSDLSGGLVGQCSSDLDKYLHAPLEGVNKWLFTVTREQGAPMPLRVEPRSLLGMNVLLPESKAKVWLAFAQKHQGRVTEALANLGIRDNEHDHDTSAEPICYNHLLHNYLLLDVDFLDELEVPYVWLQQEPCDLIITLSGTFYQSFTTGISFSESICFAIERLWVEIARKTFRCKSWCRIAACLTDAEIWSHVDRFLYEGEKDFIVRTNAARNALRNLLDDDYLRLDAERLIRAAKRKHLLQGVEAGAASSSDAEPSTNNVAANVSFNSSSVPTSVQDSIADLSGTFETSGDTLVAGILRLGTQPTQSAGPRAKKPRVVKHYERNQQMKARQQRAATKENAAVAKARASAVTTVHIAQDDNDGSTTAPVDETPQSTTSNITAGEVGNPERDVPGPSTNSRAAPGCNGDTSTSSTGARSKRNGGYGTDVALKRSTTEVDRLRRGICHAESAVAGAEATLRDNPTAPPGIRAKGAAAVSKWVQKQEDKLESQRRRLTDAKVAYEKAVRQHILFSGVRQWYIDHLGYDAYFTRLMPQGYNDPKKVVAHFWDCQSTEVRSALIIYCLATKPKAFEKCPEMLSVWIEELRDERRFQQFMDINYSERATAYKPHYR